MPYKDPKKQKEAQAKHYRDHAGKYKQSSRQARERRKERMAVLKDRPCEDCGQTFPHYVMQFDHIDSNKTDSVSRMLSRTSWDKVVEETQKCELVCANCHAIRTYTRANGH